MYLNVVLLEMAHFSETAKQDDQKPTYAISQSNVLRRPTDEPVTVDSTLVHRVSDPIFLRKI